LSSESTIQATLYEENAMGLSTISYASGALATMRAAERLPVHVMRIRSDADQAGAPPASNDGEAWIVNNWGAGNYVGIFAGQPFVDGDLAEYSDVLVGFVRVLINAATIPATGIRAIVVGAGAAGSFAAQANQIAYYDGAITGWIFTAPYEGQLIHVMGEESFAENQNWTYDVATWKSQGKAGLGFQNAVFVDQLLGSNTQGDGSFDKPLRTLLAGYTLATAGQTVVAGPGTYAETLAWIKRVHLDEMIPGTVTIANAVVGGAVFTLGGAAGTSRIKVQAITNTNNATVADVAIAITNATPAALVFEVEVGLLDGGLLGSALTFVGDATNAQPTVLRLNAKAITGSMTITTANAADLCQIAAPAHTATPATWGTVTGGAGTAGLVRFMLRSTAAGILNLGNNTAMGCDVNFEAGAWIGGELYLHNNAGAGIVRFFGDAGADAIFAAIVNQVYHKQSGHWLEVNLLNKDLNAIADTNFYTVPVGQTFLPLEVTSINRLAATGAALIYQYDGTGAASVVAAVGAGALAFGMTNNAVVRDLMAAAAVLSWNVTTATGVPGDLGDARVRGILQNV